MRIVRARSAGAETMRPRRRRPPRPRRDPVRPIEDRRGHVADRHQPNRERSRRRDSSTGFGRLRRAERRHPAVPPAWLRACSSARTTSPIFVRRNSARSAAISLKAAASSPSSSRDTTSMRSEKLPCRIALAPCVNRRTGPTTVRVRCQATATAMPSATSVISRTARRAPAASSRARATVSRANAKWRSRMVVVNVTARRNTGLACW